MGNKRCLLILLDGLSDRSHEVLGHRTPLAAASTPNLDLLAQRGSCGLMHCATRGMALPSENAHFAIFGYGADPFPGRGALEAIGAGITLKPGEVALLAHFVSVRPSGSGLTLAVDRPGADEKEISELISRATALEVEGLNVRFVPTHGLDGLVVMEGGASPSISDSDPLIEGETIMEVLPTDGAPESARTARALSSFLKHTHRRLRALDINRKREEAGLAPINFIATHRPGVTDKAQPFEKRWGLRACSISAGMIYHGLCAYLGMDVIRLDQGVDHAEALTQALERARRLKDDYAFFHIHNKGPDVAGHSKDSVAKKEIIEALDHSLTPFMEWLTHDDNLVVVTSDHATPSSGPLIHSGEPVPLLLNGKGVWRDKVTTFSEVECARGCLGHLEAGALMYNVLNHMEMIKLTGLMDSPEMVEYWPGPRRPMRLG